MRIEWSLVLRLYTHREQGFLLVGHARDVRVCVCVRVFGFSGISNGSP